MPESKQTAKSPPETANGKTNGGRFDMANRILMFGLSAVAVLGVVALIAVAIGPPEERVAGVKDVLAILLPVISVWVGTVLAYYFSEKNYAAATQSSRELMREFSHEDKLRAITAKEVMIDINKAVTLVLTKKEGDIKLKADLIDGKLDKDTSDKKNRLPVLDDKGRPKYIIHRSAVTEFLVAVVADAKKELKDLTLQEMLDQESSRKLIEDGFGTVRETANLAEVKTLIDAINVCSDVFVTENGRSDSKVLGWITNVIVAKESAALRVS